MPSIENLFSDLAVFPVMGENLNDSNSIKMDFSPTNLELPLVDISNTETFNSYVFGLLHKAGKRFGRGGYFEHRVIYSRSTVFETQESDFRDIHMGVDIWAEAGTPVFAPLDAVVHSFQDNAGFGNYGPTIILQHEIKGTSFFSLYGHLATTDLEHLNVGQAISKGEKFCHLGPYPENGDWPPHLHFQLMWDMMGNHGDFPGVCSHRDIEKYREICPDPAILIGY
jgi:murein DD-endopeptidase MepM/ murein hydrolase activator NlpD